MVEIEEKTFKKIMKRLNTQKTLNEMGLKSNKVNFLQKKFMKKDLADLSDLIEVLETIKNNS